MNKVEYLTAIQDLEERCNAENSSEVLGDYEKTYVVSCANIKKLLPAIPEEQHERICRDNYYYKQLASLHSRYVDLLRDVKMAGDLEFLNDKDTPRIYCTFHMGSYRIMNLILAYKNIDFVLVISKETLKDQKETYLKSYNEQKKMYGTTGSFEFIEAESPTSIISMVKALKNGKSLVFYIDGNTGVGGVGRTDDKMLPIDFFGNTLFARKGIAYLSYKCDVPIINCFSIMNDKREDVTAIFNPPIVPDKTKATDEYTVETTQRIYDEFSEILMKHVEQWEGWMYVNRYLDTASFVDAESDYPFNSAIEYKYNQERYKSFAFNGERFLFDTTTYQTYPVVEDLMRVLDKDAKYKVDDNVLPQEVYGFLVKKKILKPFQNC